MISRNKRFGSRDLLSIWIGYNDISPVASGTAAQRTAGAAASVGNTVAAINTLANAGGREFVVFNQKTDRATGNDVAREINGMLPGALTPLSAAGLNIHYFDVQAVIERLRANPVAFGFGPDGNTPCIAVEVCARNGTLNGGAIENQYISPDGVHHTGRTNEWIGAFLANQLNAPLTIGPQGELGQSAGMGFSSTLIDFLSAERRRNMAISVPATYTADLPGRTSPPVAVPIQVGSPLSVFALGTYVNHDLPYLATI